MRKRVLALCLALALFAAAGCSAPTEPADSQTGVMQYYYCDFETAHGGTDGVLSGETADLDSSAEPQELLAHYLEGPDSPELTAPFPDGLRCESAELQNGVLYLRLSEEYNTLSGIWLSLTNACLTKTLLQLPEVERVQIENGSGMLSSQTENAFTEESFLLEDRSMTDMAQSVMLYLPDKAAGVLRAERQTVSAAADLLPMQVLSMLFEASAFFPEGTSCMELSIQGGFCTAVLSEAFLGCDTDAQTAELAVRAVVATLCALDGVERVQLSVQGGTMQHVSLTEPLSPAVDWYSE